MEDALNEKVAQAARRAWQEVLGIDDIAPDDDFFEFGGHSLSAVRMISMVRRDIETDVKVRALMQNPKFEDFVRAVVVHMTNAKEKARMPIIQEP